MLAHKTPTTGGTTLNKPCAGIKLGPPLPLRPYGHQATWKHQSKGVLSNIERCKADGAKPKSERYTAPNLPSPDELLAVDVVFSWINR